jgi:hypothetical protein
VIVGLLSWFVRIHESRSPSLALLTSARPLHHQAQQSRKKRKMAVKSG